MIFHGKAGVIYSYSLNGNDCLVKQCHFRFSRHNRTIRPVLYNTTFGSQRSITSFFDTFLAFIVRLPEDIPLVIAGGVHHTSTPTRSMLNVTDLGVSPNRGILFQVRILLTTLNYSP